VAVFEPPPKVQPPDEWVLERVQLAVDGDLDRCTCKVVRMAVIKFPPSHDSPMPWSFTHYGHFDPDCPWQDPAFSPWDDDEPEGEGPADLGDLPPADAPDHDPDGGHHTGDARGLVTVSV
jgi:hypothetical protein